MLVTFLGIIFAPLVAAAGIRMALDMNRRGRRYKWYKGRRRRRW